MHGDDNATTNLAGQPLVAYSHAFAFKSHWFTNRLQYATVMNAGEDNPRWKLNQFSDPNVTYDDFATGTTNRSHVARRIVETTPRIANYMPEPSVVIYIDGPRFISTFGDYTFDANFEINNKEPISFRLLDVQGREILSDTDENVIKGRRLKELDISKVPAGVYILKIASGGSISTQKVTIQK